MEKFITATGKTIDLAIAAALEQLRMDREVRVPWHRRAARARQGHL